MEQMIDHIKSWLKEAGEKIQSSQQTLTTSQRSNRTDLVANVNRNIQNFLIEKIHSYDSEAKMLTGEEEYNQLADLDRGVLIIDPIGGTLNFMIEGGNLCIMLAVYESGVGKLGFIYDVMGDKLFWGGKGIGVYKNDKPMPKPANKSLSEGLLGMNSYLFGHGKYGIREIAGNSTGIRMYECAGFELVIILKENHIAYTSNLSPWDYAARDVLLKEFGMVTSGLFGTLLTFDRRGYYLTGTPCAYAKVTNLLKKEG